MKRRLVTSALPYVNNVPHLGNLIQVLSADVFARWCRLYGYDTLYICGTDEYGTATETRAMEEGITPQELCDRFHTIHKEIYDWFDISFDHFGRTSRPIHTEITQGLYRDIEGADLVTELETQQVYCPDKDMFLADRFVRGTCPHCGYKEARGDQCENCGKLLDPTDLVNPYSPICPGELSVKATRHLYIDLPTIRPRLEEWVAHASKEGFWSTNAIKMTEAWIRDGLKERAITRDLKWGIPVPRPGYEKKVFYVWFDAPIGYISMTADLRPDDWKTWWQDPDNVELFQFIGKDNIPFHTVVFPSTLLGSEQAGKRWTKLHHMSSTEYLNYEGGKFSKSAGVGVFGNDARDTGIPADVWRFYLFLNRPETSDTLFSWKDFSEKVNSELIGNFSNLVNRTLTFAARYFPGEALPAGEAAWKTLCEDYAEGVRGLYERARLRDALKTLWEWSALGNKRFQEGEPWKLIKTDPDATRLLVGSLVRLVRDLAVLVEPLLPETSRRVLGFLGLTAQPSWSMLNEPVPAPTAPDILFQKLEAARMEELRLRYGGTQKERAETSFAPCAPLAPESLPGQFQAKVRLVCAKIIGIERHPEAEKLYIERLDVGTLGERTIVSGLVPYYKEEELLGKTIVLVANLKPAKLRGVVSEGMLLAASKDDHLEVLTSEAAPGTPVVLEGGPLPDGSAPKLSVDQFFAIPLTVRENLALCGGKALTANGYPIRTHKVAEGEIG